MNQNTIQTSEIKKMVYDCSGNDKSILSLFENMQSDNLEIEIIPYKFNTEINIWDENKENVFTITLNNYNLK